jgi:hypothetical protein
MAHDVAAKPGIEREHQALLERGRQVDFMADFQEMLDFPRAP